MGLYEERLERDLETIRREVSEVGERVEHALQNALRAVLTLNRPLAYETILGDKAINRAIQKIDRDCHYFVARHLPSAGHLRFISSVLRMNVEIERIGDYAATICREAVQLSRPLEPPVRRELERLAKNAAHMLHQALRAFEERNAELAKAIMYGDLIERSFAAAFEELLRQSETSQRSMKEEFGTLVIFNMLERVGDQAINLCEETLFALTGETREPTQYRILFLDETNESLGPMAVAIARKGYPKGGIYNTAARQPASELDPDFVAFLEEHGAPVPVDRPQAIDWVPEEWADYHVIVSLQGGIDRYLDEVPFRTIALEWDVPPPPDRSLAAEARRQAFEDIYKRMASRIRDLMVALHGEDAG